MLVLSRKKDEAVILDGPGKVVVVEVRGDKVRLGFVAPDSTAIVREELGPWIRKDKPAA